MKKQLKDFADREEGELQGGWRADRKLGEIEELCIRVNRGEILFFNVSSTLYFIS